jgi:HEAT repeat protein
MNWLERFVFLGIVVAAGVVTLIALSATGVVHLPFLPSRSTADFDDGSPDARPLPPPLPDEEGGLLAEIRREGHAGSGGGDREPASPPGAASPQDPDRPPGGDATPGTPVEGADPSAGGRTRDPIVDQLKKTVDLADPGQLLAFLIATFTPRGTKLGPEDLQLLLDGLSAQTDFGVRNLLFSHLERLGGEEAIRGILGFIGQEQNPQAVARGLQALGVMADDAAVLGLVDFLGDTPNPRLRDVAFQSLLASRSGAGTDDLIALLSSTADPAVRRYSLAALSQLGGERGASAVLSFAASSDPAERAIGLKSLRDLSNPAAVPALSDALARGGAPDYRTEVIRALGRTRQPSAVTPILRSATSDPSPALRLEAIRVVAGIGGSDAVPTLSSIAAQDQHPGVRKAAERAILLIERREAARVR